MASSFNVARKLIVLKWVKTLHWPKQLHFPEFSAQLGHMTSSCQVAVYRINVIFNRQTSEIQMAAKCQGRETSMQMEGFKMRRKINFCASRTKVKVVFYIKNVKRFKL